MVISRSSSNTKGGILNIKSEIPQSTLSLEENVLKCTTTVWVRIYVIKLWNSKSFPINEGRGEDIDDLLSCGIYTTGGMRPGDINMKNYPVNATANIVVIANKYVITQMFITHDLSHFYIRGKFYSYDFSSWKQIQMK